MSTNHGRRTAALREALRVAEAERDALQARIDPVVRQLTALISWVKPDLAETLRGIRAALTAPTEGDGDETH